MRNAWMAGLVAALALVAAGCESSDSPGPGGKGGGSGGTPGTGGTGGSGGGEGGSGGIEVLEPYEVLVFDRARINSKSELPNFQAATEAVDFGAGPFARATLVVQLESTCYPFSTWVTNPPPQGQNWPADCDAYDRNFEFLLDPPEADGEAPAIELVRAITPFGGPMSFEIDITDLANGLPGLHRIRTTISTWSDGAGQVSGSNGGWNVSAHLAMVPGEAPREVLAVIPLANLNQTASGGPIEAIPFTVPEGTKGSRIEYRVTGHGGGAADTACIGHADEFCKRRHTIFVDGEEFDSFTPWRDDCALGCTLTTNTTPPLNEFDYCLENPCGDIRSVRASRANWCPGSVTPPETWINTPIFSRPGAHTFSWDIADVADGGSWRLSAVYFAFGG